VNKPVNVVMGYSSNPTTALSVADLAVLGVKRVSVGSVLSRVALGAFMRASQELHDRGTFSFADQAMSMPEAKRLTSAP